MELKATNTEQSANRETTEESLIGRQDLVKQFRNDAEQPKRKIRELEKHQQELHHRRETIEQKMRDW